MSELAEPLAPKARESRTDAGLPPWTDRAVLLYGPRKSGTSLLLNLLDGGEEIVAFPREMKLKFFLTAVWPGGQGAEVYSRLSRHAGQEFKGFSAERYRQLSEETAGRARSLREQMQIDVHNLHQSADWKPAAPRMWAMKDVGAPTLRITNVFRQHFFDGKIVTILRDPRYVSRAVYRDRRRRQRRMSLREWFYEAIDPIRIMVHQARLLEADPTIHALTYEDLVSERRDDVLRGVCAYLGVEFAEVLTRPTIFGLPAVVLTSSRQTTEIFREEAHWTDELTFVERALISLAHAGYSVLHAMSPKRYPRYQSLREKYGLEG